jgi:hypothetical protein
MLFKILRLDGDATCGRQDSGNWRLDIPPDPVNGKVHANPIQTDGLGLGRGASSCLRATNSVFLTEQFYPS